jgi:chemotaxis protein methyltransferase CheR
MVDITDVPQRFSAIQAITDEEFGRFQRFIYDHAGISLSPVKKMMVASRLQRRLVHFGLHRYGDYFRLVMGDSHPEEMQVMIDHLTTNETYFFREPEHFQFLKTHVIPEITDRPIRLWSAACSSGEEVYTLAMMMAERLSGDTWEVMGSDVSQRVLQQAQRGHYPMARNGGIPEQMLKRHCLKGVGAQAGSFLLNQQLKSHVSFRQVNLKQTLPNIGRFDIIFLRNVLIYFDQETKEQIVKRVLGPLKQGGYFFISHTESLHGIDHGLEMVRSAVYRKR